MLRAAALTGTPGSGKSSVARMLSIPSIEVGELALRMGAARGHGRRVTVDLRALARRMRTGTRHGPERLFVGHLAHLLPVRDVIILRCHPVELLVRLKRARRGTATERRENAVAEATDLILVEALRARRRVWEVDTTGRTVRDVAREVRSILDRRPRPRHGRVDWLADPAVTAHLLGRSR